MLISIETLLQILNKKIAVAKSCPSWPIVWVQSGQLSIILNSLNVFSIGSAILSKLVQVANVQWDISVV